MMVEDLWRQSMMTAHDMMMHAIADIDELLGDGYAKQHPELIAAYMHATNYDLRSMLEHDDRTAEKP